MFYDEITYVSENGLMNGIGADLFDPEGTTTRAMVVTTLWRLDGEPVVDTENPFTDVADSWYTDAVLWAVDAEIIFGYGNGKMGPADKMTREQLAVTFYRYSVYKGMDVATDEDNLAKFDDADEVSSWAVDAMNWAVGVGLFNGTAADKLSPEADASRGQIAAILYRYSEKVVPEANKVTVTFDENYTDGKVTEVTVEAGETVEKPADPTRDGYTFKGWYTADGAAFDFDAAIESDVTVLAKWTRYIVITHTHEWVVETIVPPTCTTQGYTTYTCSCGSSKDDDFVSAVTHTAGETCPHCGVTEVETADQLIAAAMGNGDVKIKMIANITIDVAAWDNNALGGEETTSIAIDGENGDVDYTLTFNQTNSDWNNVVTNNEAKLVLKNMNITNSGHNDGPWNRHDINFGCDVEMENVNSDKALAFKASASLTKVTIADANTSDTYAIWIQPNGQTVTLDGCTIDMLAATDGRGIKIDEQYVDAPAKVTLTVSGTTFKTEEKAAILVKSAAGADITLSEVDISGVVADTINAVWGDEDAAAYFGLISVTGGSKVLEGIYVVNNADELEQAVVAGKTNIWLNDGEYDVKNCRGEMIISGSKNAVLKVKNEGEDGCDYGFGSAGNCVGNVTFNGVTIDTTANTGNYKGYAYMKGTFNDCAFVGAYSLNNANDFVFNKCTFDFKDGYFWTWSAKSATFNECTFNGNSKAILAHGWASTVIDINDCTFAATEKGYASNGTVWTAAIEIDPADTNTYTIKINNSTKNENYAGWTRIKDGSTGHSILMDGKAPVADGFVIDPVSGEYEISSAVGLFNFAKQVNELGNNFSGKTVKLVSDIDLENATWTPIGQTGATEFKGVFDGQNYTIKNLNVDNSAATDEHTSSGLFGWIESHGLDNIISIENVKIDGATIRGNHNCAVIVGYLYGEVINCHVTNATVVCTHKNDDACGDKAGLIVGYAGPAVDYVSITDCTASDSSVTAGRDAGWLIGAGYTASVSRCSATNVTVTNGGDCTGANINEAIIGRVLG